MLGLRSVIVVFDEWAVDGEYIHTYTHVYVYICTFRAMIEFSHGTGGIKWMKMKIRSS